MSDLISRQAAIDAMNRLWEEDLEAYGVEIPESFDAERANEAIRNLPSAQQWIPCSERLPEDGTEVFVHLYHNPEIPYIAWRDNSSWHTDEFKVEREYEPIAWMPLPKPYRIPQSETE